MSSFTDPLFVEIEQGDVDGRGTAKLIAAFDYDVGALGSGDTVHVPVAFETDFASIPRFARPLFSNFDRAAKAAVIHDFLFSQSPRARSRASIDAVFYEAMGVLGVAGWRRWIMWASVRLQAWFTHDR